MRRFLSIIVLLAAFVFPSCTGTSGDPDDETPFYTNPDDTDAEQDAAGDDDAARDQAEPDADLDADLEAGEFNLDDEDDAELSDLPDDEDSAASEDDADAEVEIEPDADGDADEAIEAETDFAGSCSELRPVVFVHGVNGGSANYATMIGRLIADGWPEDFLFAFDAADPAWGCNVDNAEAIHLLVEHVMAVTGEGRIDLVAHSMGTLSSRYYVKNLGGQDRVNTYVTLGGMHHGLTSPCWSPVRPCIWEELCATGAFIAQLNADPATPGELNWVSIYGTADSTVPNSSSQLDGAENIALEGVEHDGANGLLERIEAYDEVKRVLEYPCW